MTRINLIPVNELTDQHLLAEHREIKRIPNIILKGKYNLKGQPEKYTLGTGHVKFFYNKIYFLHKRYNELYNECNKRGFEVAFYGANFKSLAISSLYNNYIPTKEAIELSRERIEEKIKSKPGFYRYYGKLI